jgi:hypothetical protein
MSSFSDNYSDPAVDKFWSCFNESLKINKKGPDGIRRILSIIADNFSYDEIKTNLSVSISIYLIMFFDISFYLLNFQNRSPQLQFVTLVNMLD